MKSEPTLLLIESSTRSCSVALSVGSEIRAELSERSDQFVHAEKLHLLIKEILSPPSIEKGEMIRPNAIAVSAGPGSYTGLRIGLSVAKGVAFGLSIPLIGIPSLEALYHTLKSAHSELFKGPTRAFWPMIDARRMEVYTMGLNTSSELLSPIEAMILDEKLPSHKGICFGDGADKAIALLESNNFTIIEGILPMAHGLLTPALHRFYINSFEDAAVFEPDYLKEFQAGKKKQTD